VVSPLSLACNENAVALWTRKCEISSIVTKFCANINLLPKFWKITRSFREHLLFTRLSRNYFRSTNFLPKLRSTPLHYKILRENEEEVSIILYSPFSFCKTQLYAIYSRIRVLIVLFSPETEVYIDTRRRKKKMLITSVPEGHNPNLPSLGEFSLNKR
jgi:hypothetical protein